MIKTLTLRGEVGTVVWGYRDVAELRAWRLARVERQWFLTAATMRVDAFALRQRPLYFTAIRRKPDGRWCFPILDILQSQPGTLHARLGPPEGAYVQSVRAS